MIAAFLWTRPTHSYQYLPVSTSISIILIILINYPVHLLPNCLHAPSCARLKLKMWHLCSTHQWLTSSVLWLWSLLSRDVFCEAGHIRAQPNLGPKVLAEQHRTTSVQRSKDIQGSLHKKDGGGLETPQMQKIWDRGANGWISYWRPCHILASRISHFWCIWKRIEQGLPGMTDMLTIYYINYSRKYHILYIEYPTETNEDRWPRYTKVECRVRDAPTCLGQHQAAAGSVALRPPSHCGLCRSAHAVRLPPNGNRREKESRKKKTWNKQRSTHSINWLKEVQGKIYRKPVSTPNIEMSFKFSRHPILWHTKTKNDTYIYICIYTHKWKHSEKGYILTPVPLASSAST